MSRPELSLCMIVRDEAAMLPGFLESVDGLWDQLVAADTGSRDGTPGLLTAAGADIVDFPWCDDFAAARNASLAPARGRWILFLDADERVTPELRDEIRALLRDPRAGAATLVMRNALPGGLSREARLLRLFRNDPAIRFRHRIHEDVADAVGAYLRRKELVLRHLDGVVDHLGYVREVAAARDKKDRDLGLLRHAVTEDPDDLYCWFKMLEQARFWDDDELWRRVAGEAAARVDAAPKSLRDEAWSGELAALVAQGLPGDDAARLAWLDDRAGRVRPSPAWHLRRGLLLESLGRRNEAAAAFTACLDAADPTSTQLTVVRPRLGLCRLAAADGDAAGARRHALQAAAEAPRDPEALLAAVSFAPLAGGTEALAAFVAGHLADHPAAAEELGAALLTGGHAAAAADVLLNAAADHPTGALGYVVCALIVGRELDVTVDLPQDEADAALRRWVTVLWESRRTDLMTAFADACGVLAAPFPWLAEHLRQETARLARLSSGR